MNLCKCWKKCMILIDLGAFWRISNEKQWFSLMFISFVSIQGESYDLHWFWLIWNESFIKTLFFFIDFYWVQWDVDDLKGFHAQCKQSTGCCCNTTHLSLISQRYVAFRKRSASRTRADELFQNMFGVLRWVGSVFKRFGSIYGICVLTVTEESIISLKFLLFPKCVVVFKPNCRLMVWGCLLHVLNSAMLMPRVHWRD